MAYLSHIEFVKKKNMWRAKLNYTEPKTKKRRHPYIYAYTKEELEAERLKKDSLEKGLIILGTFKDLIPKWHGSQLQNTDTKLKTLNEYKKYLDYWIEDENLNNVIVNDMTTNQIKEYLNDTAYFIRRDGKDGNVSNATKRQYFYAFKNFLSWCLENNYIQSDLMDTIKKPSQKIKPLELPPRSTWMPMWSKIFNALDEEIEEEKTANERFNTNNFKKIELSVLVHLSLELGSRQGELTALEWQRVDLDNNEIIINQNLNENKEIQSTKAEKNYKISISQSMSDELKMFKILQNDLINNRVDKTHNYVFKADNDGNPYRNSSIYRKWRRFLERHNIDYPEEYGNFRFHDIRHFSASFLFSNIEESESSSKALERISKRLGHSSSDFTRRYYIYYVPEDDKPSSNMFENFRKTIKETKEDSD